MLFYDAGLEARGPLGTSSVVLSCKVALHVRRRSCRSRADRRRSSRALRAGGQAVRHPDPAGRGRRADHRRAGLRPRPRRARADDLQPAHFGARDQGAPGRDLLPQHPQRAAPARRLEDGGRRHARLPRRRRRARRPAGANRGAPARARLVRQRLHAQGAPAARRRDAGPGVPAGRVGALFPAGLVHRRQSLSQGSAQAGRRTRRRRRLQQIACDLPPADAHGVVDAELRRLPPGRPPHQPHHLLGREGSRVRHVAARRPLPDVEPRRRRGALRPGGGSFGDMPGGFCRLPAVQRRAPGLHGRPRDRPGRRDRRAGGAAFDRRARQHRDRRPALAAGGPGRDRRGLSRRAPTSSSARPRACSSRIATSTSPS